jgi:hypothetical protein
MPATSLTSSAAWRYALLGTLLYALNSTPGQSAPANDDFANSTLVSGSSLTITSALAGSTYEQAEFNSPFHTWVGGSVWYTWTAPASTPVVIELVRDVTSFSSTNTMCSVYTGFNLNYLTLVDENSFDWPSGRYVSFNATYGTTYYFRVAGGWAAPFSLKLTATNPPLFLKEPADCVVSPFGSAFFTAMAAGPHPNSFNKNPVSYQWLSNGIPIPGETGASLLVNEVTTNKIANYSVIASNAGGITTSKAATFSLINTNPIPQLVATKSLIPGQATFTLAGEVGRWYRIESTLDLSDWPTNQPRLSWSIYVSWFKHTNETVLVSVPKLGPGPVHYNRACLNVHSDICAGQLRQLTWAQQLAAIDNTIPATADPLSLGDLKPYIPLSSSGGLRPCPENGAYEPAGRPITNPVTCAFANHGHVIDAP